MRLSHLATMGITTTFFLGAVSLGAAGCGSGGTIMERDAGAGGMGGSGGNPGSGGAVDAGPDVWGNYQPCPGKCVAGPAITWDFPALIWMADTNEALPVCTMQSGALVYEGYADLEAPLDCGTCTCGKPSGSCSLPGTMTANAASCALTGPSTAHTAFDPASGWNGSCDTNQSIPSGKLCGGQKCVQSLTTGPLAVTETGCVPSQPPAQKPPTWHKFARGCKQVPSVPCDPISICVLAPPEPGYRVCIAKYGDYDCPDFGPYSEKFLFYNNNAPVDTRACSDCTCGPPSGGACSATVSVFTDGACGAPAYSAIATSTGPSCHDLPAGVPLGSKSATAPVYNPGSCAPGGGEPSGAVTAKGPVSLCCLPL